MPMHKRESLIYTIMMCFTMVLWMSIYNVTLHMGILNVETIKEAWLGFPIAYVFAMLCDWFVVSGPAKGFAFRFLVNPDSSTMKKVIAVSCCMVVPMVIIMSFYGGMEACVRSGEWSALPIIWLTNYGVAVSADRCGTACEKSLPYGISSRNHTCGVIYRILGL